MRDRNLLRLFLGLNVALAAAFLTYLYISNNGQPKVVTADFSRATNVTRRVALPVTNAALATNVASVRTVASNAPTAMAQSTNVALTPVFTQKKFGWKDVESPEYVKYMNSLRAVGCPEEKVRNIILGDINDLFQQKKLQIALQHDQQWWKAQTEYLMANVMQERGHALEEERQGLIEKLLGSEVAEKQKESLLWNSVQLTGPVLGNLPAPLHNQVQEICADSIQRHQAYFWERANQGQPLNNVEMANLREHTRSELRKILSPIEVEEFVLRYSHNASQLREELRAMDPTPDEFRKVFRATDPLDHQMQMEFGGVEGMSEKQRERYQKDRESAIREALGPQRFQAYALTKDPLYRQAQITAMQYGAPTAILPIYEMAKVSESKRQRILRDATLTPQQRVEALNALNVEQQRSVQQIVNESTTRR